MVILVEGILNWSLKFLTSNGHCIFHIPAKIIPAPYCKRIAVYNTVEKVVFEEN